MLTKPIKKMKKYLLIVLLLNFFIAPSTVYSQKKCDVLLSPISGSYKGKCKKGKANGKGVAIGKDTYIGHFKQGYPNGKGTYTWANGDEYIGNWCFGKRDGVGILKFNHNGNDSIQEGIWKDDKYIGPIPPPPTIDQSRNVQNYSFQKRGNQNKFTIEIFMNGSINSTIEDLVIFSSTGSYQNIGNKIVFSGIIYPTHFKITYKSWNKLHTKQFDVVFEFEMHEPGNWVLRLTN